ncbi:O-antigen translocase [Pelagibacterium sp. H642]|uniref:O-antigen translocase n=1 Tax=Pelagibacterium sp. H642 TaxID=1881069 RepID=UPI00281651AB|nr:O-antigen translocase [Pelagibacterium sp. H642]WMT92838.1 O-antigen translocase [Pelagibacterium sp. H642]
MTAHAPNGPSNAQAPGQSYSQILRSTAVIGLAYGVVTLVSIIRMKSLALLLGPAGIGLLGLFTLVVDLAAAIAAMGIHASGVRQISASIGSGDSHEIGGTAVALRWLSLGLGLLGGAILASLYLPVSVLTFGNGQYGLGVALLGGVVLLRLMHAAEATILQGVRRTRDIAMSNIFNAIAGTALTVGLIYLLGTDGVVPALLAAAVAGLLIVWHYTRRITMERPPALSSLRNNAAPLLRLGFVFMISALLMSGAAYVIRIIITHDSGVEAAGLYQASWGVAALYAGFVLQAMGTDFYPRLSEHPNDNELCNRLVNEQARVSMLLAGPGVILTIAMAPLVLAIFYSEEFAGAVSSLRWLCLGMMLRIVAWPIGFIVIAKGAQKAFFWTEVAATVVHVGLAALLVPWLGVDGAGIAFLGLYAWHSMLVYLVVRSLSGFRWNRGNIRLGGVYFAATALTFLGFSVLPLPYATAFGLLAALFSGVHSLRELLSLVPVDTVPHALRPLLVRMATFLRVLPVHSGPGPH